MKTYKSKRVFVIALAICLVMAFSFSIATAQNESYDIKVTTVSEYFEDQETTFAHISIPAVSGLAEGMAYREINDELAKDGNDLIEKYEKERTSLAAEFDEDDMPHFGYTYSYQIVTDNDDWFVLKTIQHFAAGSSNTVTKFYNFSKSDGILVGEDALSDEASEAKIAEYIKGEMTKLNTAENDPYDLDEVDAAVVNVLEKRHFYYNDKNELVIVFDKYEVAYGAAGGSEFVIPAEVYG